MGICNQKISIQRACKRFGGNANNVDTIGKGEIKQVEAGVRLRSPIIIPVDPYFRYRQHVRIDPAS